VKFTLNAGRTAPQVGAVRPSIPQQSRNWQPNMEPDTLLQCGCTVPWPILALVGSGGKRVICSDHGRQHVTEKEVRRCNRLLKAALEESDQLTLEDIPPF